MSIKKTLKPQDSNNISIFLIISFLLHLILPFLLPQFTQEFDKPEYISEPVVIDIPEEQTPIIPSGEIADVPKDVKSEALKRMPGSKTAKRLADRQLKSEREMSPKSSIGLPSVPETTPQPEQPLPLSEPEPISEPKPMPKHQEIVKEQDAESSRDVKEEPPKDAPKAKEQDKETDVKPPKEEIAQVVKEEKKEGSDRPDKVELKDSKKVVIEKTEVKEEIKKTAEDVVKEKPASFPKKELPKDERRDIRQKTEKETTPEKKEIKEPERMLPREKLFPSGERLAELDKEYQQKGVPGLEEGKTLSLNTSEFRYYSYLMGIKRRIELVWNYPYAAARAGQQGKLELSFTIKKDGTVEEIKILKSSGYAMLDNEAISAIKLAAPFTEFPKGFNLERFTIAATFEYIIQPFFFRRDDR
ncbi:MAG: TonB family protein [Deltaproteobacteria bacterium]|nr:TonB family protein [Deltaproteobacteria bacterium]